MKKTIFLLSLIAMAMTGSAQLAAPSLYSPNNASNDCYTRAVFQWYRVNNATGYLLQIDTVSTFNSSALMTDTLHNSGSQSIYSYTHYNLHFKTRYYWRMCATNATDTSGWSEVRWLRTMTKVTLNSPDNNASCYTRLYFTWYNSRGCTSYILQLDTTPSFNSPLLRTSVTSSSATNEATLINSNYENDLLFSTNYYWRVRAINAADTSSWSEVWQFHTHAGPSPYNPDNNASCCTRLYFTWYNSRGCTSYILQLDTTPSFNSPLLRTSNTDVSATNTNTYIYSDFENDLLFNTNYYWRVCGINAADTSSWSEVRQIHTHTGPSPYNPDNNASSYTRLYFTWYNSRGCTSYILQLDTTPSFNSPLLRTSNTDVSATNTNTYIYSDFENDLLFNTNYYWRVCGINAADTSSWSDVRQIHTQARPELNSPADNATFTGRDVTLWCYRSFGCIGYDFQLDTAANFNSPLSQTYTATSTQNNSDTYVQKSVTGLRYGYTYHWRVRCYNNADTSDWSLMRTFTTPCMSTAPQLSAPANGATGQGYSMLILSWSTLSGMTGYHYEVSTASTFGTLFASGSTTSTFATLTNLAPYQTYYWHVRGYNNDGNTIYSVVWSFTVQGVSVATPTPLSPADGETIRIPSPTLQWSTSTWSDRYEVQFGFDSATLAATPAVGTDSAQITFTNLPEGLTYYWRVRALYMGYDTSEWSATYHFTTRYCQDSYSTIEIAACDSYTWKDTTYTQSGTYTFDTLNTAGCDSTVTLNLTISYSAEESFADTATAEYHWNDSTYYESGDYIQNLATVAGCDSTVTLHLVILPDADIRQAEVADSPYTLRASADLLTVEGLADETVRLYDLQGRLLQSLRATERCTLRVPAPGIYLLQVGNHKAEKVVAVW